MHGSIPGLVVTGLRLLKTLVVTLFYHYCEQVVTSTIKTLNPIERGAERSRK